MFGKCHRSIPNGQEGKTATANTVKPLFFVFFLFIYLKHERVKRFNTTEPEITGVSFIQVPDVKLTGIVGPPCAALDTTVNRCARDV